MQFAWPLNGATVSVREVVKDETDDLINASGACFDPGGIDGFVKTFDIGNIGDPDEGSDLLNAWAT